LIQLRTSLLSTRARTSADAQSAAPSDAIATTRPLKNVGQALLSRANLLEVSNRVLASHARSSSR